MNTRLTIDRAGRVVLPKPLREEMDLSAGDTLELQTSGDKITLRPVRTTSPLAKEKGVWVFHGGEPLAATVVDDVVKGVREKRDRDNRGED